MELAGGGLAKILGTYVVEAPLPKKPAKRGAKLEKEVVAALGHPIPAEIVEWVDAVDDREDPLATGGPEWMLQLELEQAPKDVHEALWRHGRLFMAGLVAFGADADGDQVWVSLRPHPLGVAEVYRYDHELGTLAGKDGESIADFLVHHWIDDDHRDAKTAAKARTALAKQAADALAKQPKGLRSDELWARSRWLDGLLADRPALEFPDLLAKAPSLEVWNAEQASLAKEPQLAVYWMLAHLFFGNDEACKQAIAGAKKSQGKLVVALAGELAKFLAGKARAPWDGLRPGVLEKGRALVAKNARPAQTGKPPEAGDIELARHDAELRALATREPDKRALVAEYFRERTEDASTEFPYKKLLPEWLVPAAAAAFKSGVRYDREHPDAYAGLTRALAGRVAHPEARAALIAGLDVLGAAEPRLEYIIPALVGCGEPEAWAAVQRAARRWIELAPEVDNRLKQREAAFDLDSVFARDDLLAPAVHAVLVRCDDEAETLARAISGKGLSFRVMKRIAGLVCRVYGKRGLVDRVDKMRGLLVMLDDVATKQDPNAELRLDATACVLMAEASLAVARLAPDVARAQFVKTLAVSGRTAERQAAVAACLLPGLLFVDPKHEASLEWLHRILGGRTGCTWLYGALIAVREAKLVELIPEVTPHAYLSRLNDMMDQPKFLEDTARETLAALGSPAPDFDDTDEYAEHVPVAELGGALLDPRRYRPGTVLSKMKETPAKQGFIGPVATFLDERVRWTKYEAASVLGDIQEAADLLRECGAAGKQEITRIATLPGLGDWAKRIVTRKR